MSVTWQNLLSIGVDLKCNDWEAPGSDLTLSLFTVCISDLEEVCRKVQRKKEGRGKKGLRGGKKSVPQTGGGVGRWQPVQNR